MEEQSKLQQLRAKKQWSQQRAAIELEVDITTLNRWERGKARPHGYHISKLCTVYGCSEAELELGPIQPRQKPSLLVQFRRRKHWTLQRAAIEIGVSVNTLNRWELGLQTPYLQNIDRLCTVYGCTEEELGLALKEIELSVSPSLSGIPASPSPLVAVPVSPENTLRNFQQQDLTLRLLRITNDCSSRTITCQQIQGKVLQMLKDSSKQSDTKINRREAIWRLAAFPLELYGLAALGSTFQASTDDVSKLPPQGVVAHCAAGIAACWNLSTNTDELAAVTNIALSYIPALAPIVVSSPSYCNAAADVLVQCYLLRATYARLMEGSNDAFTYIRKAEEYSRISGSVLSHALTLRTLASAHSYANNYTLALQSAEQARLVLEKARTPVPPMIASFVYAGLANYQAQQGQKQQALTSLGRAHTTFFASSGDEAGMVCVDHDESNLLLNDGMTHFHLNMPRKAHDSFLQLQALPKKSALLTVETMFNQVMTEVYRAHPDRDMEYCITHWTQGVEGARIVRSDQRFNEALVAYAAMRAAWPTESRVKELQSQLIHW